jgi:serine/threonine-protein kinase
VVTIFDLGQDPDDGALYLVMEFITGRDLDTVLRTDGLPGLSTAVDWAAQTAAALQAAHTAGVIHRDLKPANLMLTGDGRIKILDFGIARYMASTHKSSKVIGTLAYMPPERFGDHSGDARSDLYSLGCVLHELLTGSPPFQAGEPVALMAAHLNTAPKPPGLMRPGVPAALDALVIALLAKDPEDRPASAAKVCDALRSLRVTPPTSRCGGRLSDTDTETMTAPLTAIGASAAPIAKPEPVTGRSTATRHISRRTALWLGIGAATSAGIAAAGFTLFDRDTPDRRLRWRCTTKSPVTSSPTVAGGVVYLGDTDGNVYALDATTGKRQWHYPTGGKVEGTPTVAGGMVYTGSADGSVYALDAATGKRRWHYLTGTKAEAAPTVADGVAYVGGHSEVIALDAVTGRKRWVVLCDSGLELPTVAGGVVYVAGFDSVTALDGTTGEKKWVRRASDWGFDHSVEWDDTPEDWAFTSPTVSGETVYIGSSKRVYALDAATGTKRWAYDTGDRAGSAPTVADDVVYTGCYDKKVYALDAATGNRRWAFDTGGKVEGTPKVTGEVVYVGSADHKVYALDVETGQENWSYATGGGILSSPAVTDGVVYVGSRDHSVYALDTVITDGPARRP